MSQLFKIFLSIILFFSVVNATNEQPTKEEIAKLYVATFNRAPDLAGLDYWVNDSGLSLSGIAKSFFVQIETQTLYPQETTNRNFINSVYQNLFNRTPDSAGWNYWEDKLNGTNTYGNNSELSKIPKDYFILAAINGALDNENGMDKTILGNKTLVAIKYVDVLGSKTNIANMEDVQNNPIYKASIKILSKINEDMTREANAIEYIGDAAFSADSIAWINSNWDIFIETTLAETTTQNAFKAYDAMSISTYLPSLFAHIYDEITDGGAGGHWTCNINGGSFDVSFIALPENALEGYSHLLYPGSYEFNNCQFSIDGKDVLLDGKILSYSMDERFDNTLETDIIAKSITGYIKSGFKIEIDNDISMTYKAFPFKGASELMGYFNEDGEGSFFGVSNYTNGIKSVINRVSFKETTIGDVIYEGSFANTLDFTGEYMFEDHEYLDEVKKGIYPMVFADDTTNFFFSNDFKSWDRYGKLLIYINKNEYFKEGERIDLKISFMGKNDKNVTVWQDSDEVVHAETENTADSSLSVHTPSFN